MIKNKIKNKIVNIFKKIDIIHLIIIYSFFNILNLITKFHLVLWDEAVYIGMGKYIFSSGQIGLWESLRPIALPFLLGIPWKLNINQILSARIIELIFTIGIIALVYLISKKIFNENKQINANKQIALLNAFLIAITPVFFYNSMRIMSAIPSIFFALLAVYFFISKKYFFAGALSSIAFLFRFPTGLILFSLFLALFIEFIIKKIEFKIQFKQLIKKSLSIAIGFLPLTILFLIFNKIMYGNLFYTFIKAAEHQSNPVHLINSLITNIFYYPIQLFLQNPIIIIFAVIALFFIFTRRDYKTNKINANYLPIITPIIVYCTYFTYITNKQPRFSLAVLPFIVMLAGYGIYKSFQYLSFKKSAIKFIFFFIILLSLIFSIYLCGCKFNSFPENKPAIVDEYYKYFPDNYNGLILASDPVPVAYRDIKIQQYYYSVMEGLEEYDNYILNASALMFNKAPFICVDEKCEQRIRPLLFARIQSHKLVFEKQYADEKRWIYLVE